VTIDGPADLALPGEFRWSDGPNAAAHPADHRHSGEHEFGTGPPASLVELLEFRSATRVVDGTLISVWPAAAAYDDWESVPAFDRAELAARFTPEDMEAFADENLDFGQSLGIDEFGDWRWFVTPGA
jgi:hypothetical protein